MRIRAALALSSLVLCTPIFAAVRQWTGTAGANWTTPGNWSGGVAPSAGDDLQFFPVASNPNNVHNYPAGTEFHSLSISGAAYNLGGNSILVGPGGIAITAATISLPLVLETNETWNGIDNAVIAGGVDLNGFTLTMDVHHTPNGNVFFRTNPITGSGAIIKTNSGSITLQRSNTYAGITTIVDGSIVVEDPNALGVQDNATANGTVVVPTSSDGGTLVLNNVHVGTEHVTLGGPGVNSPRIRASGASALDGTVLLSGGSAFIGSGGLTFNGLITGPGGFALLGDVTLGHSGNNWTGGMFWSNFVTLQLNADNALPVTEQPQVGAFGIFRVNGRTQTLRTVTGAGFLLLGGNGQLTLTNASGTYSGVIGDAGTITLQAGSWTLTGQNVNGGTFANNGGALTIDTGKMTAPYLQTAGSLTVTQNGTAGPGTTSGGSFAPLAGGNTANLLLAAPATFAETTPAVTHVTGTVTLGNATLSVTTPAPLPAGTQLTIIDNDAADAVVGTFAGLPEGSLVFGTGQAFHISYVGGSGNDVVLTAIAATDIPMLDWRALVVLALLMTIIAIKVAR